MQYTLNQIQLALAYWGEREGPGDGVSVGPVVGLLADIWAVMVYEGLETVAEESLTTKQCVALRDAGI
ncbi:DUF3717 domain-containing protein [Bordetella flabilis]|uniref:DUF3717 domain-containing protein n=1 Tax=Bordetella flabilis TaxID=463014 RepID=A0A193GLA2_9BORD|nr:DUF3717 domain-containing protein [Bordetella flabilis]ANN80872.1 hypothetical protein BAU07_26490 [Bordetella flabilis]